MTILVIGGGKMGMSHLALITQYVGKANIALCDSKLTTRMIFRFLGYRTFSSVDTAAKKLGKLAGIVIATPTSSHALLSRWAIESNVPFFVEKPLTLDAEQSSELVTQAEKSNVNSQVGFVLRYIATFQRLRQLVNDGHLGKVKSYSASMRGFVITKPPSPDSWQGNFSKGGGCLNEYGPHVIDLCRFIFGAISKVESAAMKQVYSTNADDSVFVDWRHEGNITGHLEIDWSDPSKRKSVNEFRVEFEHANVRVDNSALEVDWHDGASSLPKTITQIDTSVEPKNVGFYLRGEEFSLEIEDFLSICLGSNQHVDPTISTDTKPSLSDGCEVDRLIDEIAKKVGLK